MVDLEPAGAPRRQVMRGGFATRAEAEAEKAKVQQDRTSGAYVEPSRLTVAQYLAGWLSGLDLRREVAGNTLDGWRICIERHLGPRIGAVRLQQLTQGQIRACYRDLQERGRADGKGGLSAKSTWNVHLCLSRALGDAVKDGLLRDNLARGAIARPRRGPELHFWTSVELAAFFRWLDATAAPHDKALYRLAAQTGMRRGELLGLRWSDIDWERGQLTIVQARPKKAYSTFAAPKTTPSRRTIDPASDTMATLKVHREAQEFQRRGWAEAYQPHDLVFCREDGSPHDVDVTTARFREAITAAGVKRIRLHDLRHTSAVIGLRELSEWPDEVSKRLGHTPVAFTLDTYGHLLPKRGKEIAASFDSLLRGRREAVVRNL